MIKLTMKKVSIITITCAKIRNNVLKAITRNHWAESTPSKLNIIFLWILFWLCNYKKMCFYYSVHLCITCLSSSIYHTGYVWLYLPCKFLFLSCYCEVWTPHMHLSLCFCEESSCYLWTNFTNWLLKARQVNEIVHNQFSLRVKPKNDFLPLHVDSF